MRKKLMAVILSCLTLLTLVLSSAWAPMRAGAVSVDEMARVGVALIRKSEGTYGSINANDNGAVSVGILQWHADRALDLMRTVASQEPTAESTLGASFYQEVMTASSWNTRTFSTSEAAAASALLSTDTSVAIQESLAASDVAGYIQVGQQRYGLSDPAVLVYYADIYNRGSGVAARILKAANTNGYENITLEQLHQAALDNSSSYYTTRLMNAYNTLSNMDWEDVPAAPAADTSSTAISATSVDKTTDEDTTITIAATPSDFSGDYAGAYVVTASSLNVRSAPDTGAAKIGSIADGETVEVASSNGSWAEIAYADATGYCSMDYLMAADLAASDSESESESVAETTTAAQETTTAATTTEPETTEATEVTTTTTETTTEATTTTQGKVQEYVPVEGVSDPIYATVYGDVNGDGVVDISDAVMLQRYLDGYVLLNDRQLANGDGDRDGILNATDVVAIMQHATGKLTALPVL